MVKKVEYLGPSNKVVKVKVNHRYCVEVNYVGVPMNLKLQLLNKMAMEQGTVIWIKC